MKKYKCGHVDIILSDKAPEEFDSVLVFLNSGTKWVLGFNPARNGWELPGGHREAGETLFQTAEREALEEVGVQINDVEYKGYYILPNKHKTAFVTAKVETLDANHLMHEITEVGLFDEFPQNITFKDGVYSFTAELLAADNQLCKAEFVPSHVQNWESVWNNSKSERYSLRDLRNKIAEAKIEIFQQKGVLFRRGEKVLESGCGDASLVISLAEEYGIKAAGVDFSTEALSKAKLHAESRNVDLRCAFADARCTPFSDGDFDKVISLGIIEHFKSPKVALAENFRILNSSGLMILMTPNKNSFGVIDRKAQLRIGKWPFGYQTEYTPNELKCISEEAGFKTLASFSSQRPLYLKDKLNLQMVGLLDRACSPFRPDSGFYSWYIGCKP
ncbi:MAG: methyltransferase domain-containing protein [Alphaproteobacteria bacterium]|nr:methyltransferase domain-containing protein [Alphaproteobacteria bacterium]